MTLLFNLEYLENICSTASSYIKTLKFYKDNIPIQPPNGVNKRFRRSAMHGESFLLNTVDLFNDKSTDPSYIVQYIKLAARRDHAMYKLYNITYLDLTYYPDLDRSKISHNPLLKIAGNNLYFKYEEISHGNRIQQNQRQSTI